MFERFRLAWEVLTTGQIKIYEQRIKALVAQLNAKVRSPISAHQASKPQRGPETLPFPHTGPTRTSFD